MAQEYVLIAKSKYDYLLKQVKPSKNEQIGGQETAQETPIKEVDLADKTFATKGTVQEEEEKRTDS